MSLKERIYSILIVSASGAFDQAIAPLLPEFKFEPRRTVTSISAAKRELAEFSYDMIIINSPLPDDIGTRFAIDVSLERSVVVLLMVKAELYAIAGDSASEYGVYVLPKPTSKAALAQALDFMAATRERLKRLEYKSISTEAKMQEIRLVNRAKWLLIEKLQISEAAAHRYIEKQAMDRCVSKREIADELINKYT